MFEGLFQPMHLLIIFAIALLVFGPKKLPELGKGLGEGIRALKEGMKDGIKDSPAQASNEPSKKDTETKSEPRFGSLDLCVVTLR
jgi:sec-independent protein translocase protein TatA